MENANNTPEDNTPEPEPTEGSIVPQEPPQLKRTKISGDVLLKNIQHLPREQQDPIIWLHDYMSKNRLDNRSIGQKLRKENGQPYSEHQVYMMFRGDTANRDVASFCASVVAFRKLADERANIQRAAFTETSLTREIFTACDASRIYQRVSFLIGPTQIGKTENLKEYARRNNHGKTIYLRLPEGGRLATTISKLCAVLNLPEHLNVKEATRRILKSFRDDSLLIVDEAHQPFICGEHATSYRIFEFLREIFDETKCGLVLSATSKLVDVMRVGRFKGIFSQLKERELATIELPEKPSDDDLDLFAAKYKLEPAEGEALALQTRVLADRSIGFWLTLLSAASRLASKADRPVTWADVIKAHATIESLKRGGAR
jgi:DNA transposition AAA+ family ATPase